MRKLRSLASCIWRITMHKVHVYRAGRVMHLPVLRLLRHDLSKYGPSEIFGYAGKFHDGPEEWKALFPAAWKHHWQNNSHHWEWWRADDSAYVHMSAAAAQEMVADWFAASRQYNGEWPKSRQGWKWWQEVGTNLKFSDITKLEVEQAMTRLFWWTNGHG